MSKKLTGNGLWESSRMMLPQHKYAINEHRRRGEDENVEMHMLVLSPEEAELARDAILLPYVDDLMESYLKEITGARHLRLNSYYVSLTELLHTRIRGEYSRIRKQLQIRLLNVQRGDSSDDSMSVIVQRKGGETTFEMTKAFARDRMIQMLRTSVKEITNAVKNSISAEKPAQ